MRYLDLGIARVREFSLPLLWRTIAPRDSRRRLCLRPSVIRLIKAFAHRHHSIEVPRAERDADLGITKMAL